ncbi:MAG TPA: CotH kinase family protein, partial [Polyangiaceae bacterium]|nr:CotH kinase family protein [Polyangiaceae bacterium]
PDVTSFAAAPVVASGAGVHIRGQSSVYFEKKPYRLELRDGTDADRDCPMFDMPADSDWVLNPPFPDKALIRNAFVYSLGPEMGLAAPRGRLVEVYINSEPRALRSSDYQGVYFFVETIKNQKYRLNLQQLEPSDTMLPDIQGGYIFEFDWQSTDIDQPLPCPEAAEYCWDWLGVVDPKAMNQDQHDYLASHLAGLAAAFHAEDPADPELGYPAFIDTASFVNRVIINELTRNVDGYVRSLYFYKDRNTKVLAGPLWDFDVIAGVGWREGPYDNVSIDGWQYEVFESPPETLEWFRVLMNDATFRAALEERWRELRQGVLSNAELVAQIRRLTQGLANAAERNFERWPILTTEQVARFETSTADTWQGQVDVMQEWLLRRAEWLDTQW